MIYKFDEESASFTAVTLNDFTDELLDAVDNAIARGHVIHASPGVGKTTFVKAINALTNRSVIDSDIVLKSFLADGKSPIQARESTVQLIKSNMRDNLFITNFVSLVAEGYASASIFLHPVLMLRRVHGRGERAKAENPAKLTHVYPADDWFQSWLEILVKSDTSSVIDHKATVSFMFTGDDDYLSSGLGLVADK